MAQVNYLEILDQAWQQHLALRKPDAPTVVSLFAGCGGSSLGYSMAGYREFLAVEWNDNAVATLKLNFPDVPVYHGDIHKLSVEECLELTGLKPGELDLLDGSPPCQGFSTAGKRKMTDKRNQLYMEYVRLLRGLQPKVFVMENVSGLVKGKMKLIFADIMKELKASGYKVRCKLLNAMYFNVPQSRQRLIWIGVRGDVERKVGYPEPTGKPIVWGKSMGSLNQTRPPELQDNRFTRFWSRVPVGGALDDVLGKGRNQNNMVKPDPRLPFPTVPKSQTNRGAACMVHYAERRMISISELKRISAYPDDFVFSNDYFEQWAQIGNSVPPLFMYAIANHIRNTILTVSKLQEEYND